MFFTNNDVSYAIGFPFLRLLSNCSTVFDSFYERFWLNQVAAELDKIVDEHIRLSVSISR